jgi:predicted metal-dependent hydrolase
MRLRIDRIIRTDRRTVSLEISRRLDLIVRAPRDLPLWRINDLVDEKYDWVQRKREQLKNLGSRIPPLKNFREGELFHYLGIRYPLKISGETLIPFTLKGNCFLLAEEERNRARDWFVAWYNEQARNLIPLRVRYYSFMTGLRPARIRISDARGRWGSCSSRGSLNIAWRLIQAPLAMVDYVIVHELVHLRVRNHSSRFWQEVGQLYPPYKEARKWLRDNALSLDFP